MSASSNSGQNTVWSMVRLGLILAVYAASSCAVLAIVNNFTSPVIRANQERKANEAMRAVFETAETFKETESPLPASSMPGVTIDSITLALSGGDVVGAVAQVSGPTYDRSTIMVGMDLSRTITGMRYLENTDTPGFGQKGSDPTFTLPSGQTFYGQFTGKNADGPFVVRQNFDAISGATITSTGIGNMVTAAAEAMGAVLEEYRK
ncbi:MAG: FMN-binding protein [Treponema sp.]|nr:FMN-binding protein [Treponema sp.]